MGPQLALGDGALGFWKALRQVYPGFTSAILPRYLRRAKSLEDLLPAAWLPKNTETSASTAWANNSRAPACRTSVIDEPCVGEITFGALLGLAQTLEVFALLPKRGSGEQGAADKDGDAQPDSNPSHKFLPSPSGFSVSGAECFHRATRFGSNPGEILLLYGDDPSLPTMGAGSVDPFPPGATFANWG